MSVAWAVFEPRLQRMLKSLDDVTYGPELRQDAVNAALRALCSHTAKQVSVEFTGNGTTQSWSLPPVTDPLTAGPLNSPDWYEAIWDDNLQNWLEPVRFAPGDDWVGGAPPGFYMWPHGTLNLTFAPESGKKIKVYYYAYWADVTVGTSKIVEPPDWAWNAVLNYAAAYCLVPGSASAARIRQYNTQVDSGNPEHNPVLEQAKYHLEQYETELRRWAPQQRGMLFTPGRAK